jgi:hypothetical protein
LQKFLCVGRGGFGVFEPGEHPGDLAAALVTFDNPNRRRGDLSGRRLFYDKVPISKRSNLWKVRDNEHLRGPCQPCETAPYFDRGASTDSGIHFVEDQRACGLRSSDRNLEGEHDARKFAT